jgi:hypothetical protein
MGRFPIAKVTLVSEGAIDIKISTDDVSKNLKQPHATGNTACVGCCYEFKKTVPGEEK